MEAKRKYTFPKLQHLTGEITIAQLFREGNKFVVFPLRVVVRKVEKEKVPMKVLVSVPKRLFKHATDRNRYKRLIRESFRLNFSELKDNILEKDYSLQMAFVAIDGKMPTFAELQPIFERIAKKMEEHLL